VGEDLAGAGFPGRHRLSQKAGVQDDLDALGFTLAGYGCTTCIGNSGPLDPAISKAINDNDLIACSVLSGNRNFEGRVNPDVRANYLASPPLVVAYAIAGNLNVNITEDPLGEDQDGNPVYLKDIWPTTKEITDLIRSSITDEMFRERYGDVFKGDEHWQGDQGGRRHDLRLAGFLDLCAEPALFRGHDHGAEAARGYRGRGGHGPVPGFRSPPTTSRRPVTSRPTARQGQYLSEHQVARRTSTPTARAAATTRS
jgi:aconitate hydratase